MTKSSVPNESYTNVVGILNVTPDSFSDGGECFAPDAAIEQAKHMLEQGASVLDVGAESTRPGAQALSGKAEIDRLQPILKELVALCRSNNARLSVDTYHPETVEFALGHDVDIINDVSGGKSKRIWELVASSRASLVLMHSLTLPASKSVLLSEDPLACFASWTKDIKAQAKEYGLEPERLIIDPGIGFGKSAKDSWQLLAGASKLVSSGIPVMIGHSRKSFLASVTDKPAADRDFETAILTAVLALQNIDYIRVHNVQASMRALRVAKELLRAAE